MENNSLFDKLRVQKVWYIHDKAFCLEVYRPLERRSYLIIDIDQKHRSFHIQNSRPQKYLKTHPLLLLLKKYVVGKKITFFRNIESRVIFGVIDAQQFLHVDMSTAASIAFYKDMCAVAYIGYVPPKTPCIPLCGFDKSDQWSIIADDQKKACWYETQRAYTVNQEREKEAHKKVHAQIKKQKRLIVNLQDDQKKFQAIIAKEKDAALLRYNIHAIKRGSSSVVLTDFSETPPLERTIALDPSRSPKEYVNALFAKIKRARRGLKHIAQRLISEKKYLEVLKHEQENVCITVATQEKNHSKEKKQVHSPFRTFISLCGTPILVGKSAKDSDIMLRKHAQGNNWWFHVREARGTHVIVKTTTTLDSETMLDAATLALWFSQAKGEQKSLVTYCQVKNLRKPKGALPGKVLINGEKTIVLSFEHERIERLLKNRQSSI